MRKATTKTRRGRKPQQSTVAQGSVPQVSDKPGSSTDQRRLLLAHDSHHDIFGQMSLSGQT
jgi:hypothetical protein